MAKYEFVTGVQCKKCGNMITDIDIFTSELCQECGAYIISVDCKNKTYVTTTSSKDIIIKRTNRFLRPNILEYVRDI